MSGDYVCVLSMYMYRGGGCVGCCPIYMCDISRFVPCCLIFIMVLLPLSVCIVGAQGVLQAGSVYALFCCTRLTL